MASKPRNPNVGAVVTGTQDDLASLSGILGYRADDHPESPASADPLQQNGGQYSGAEDIEQNGDGDWFSFTTAGGTVSFTVSTPTGGMLCVRGHHHANNSVDYSDQTASGASPVSVQANLPAGAYRLFVGASGYGNLGQYSISGAEYRAAIHGSQHLR